MSRLVSITFLLALLVLVALPARGQIGQANLGGTVRDSSGAVIPNAQVTLKNIGTGEARSVKTGSAGEYVLPNLAPGDYSLTIQARGFKAYVVGSLELHTSQHASVNATLQIGTQTQKVTVASSVPLVTTNSTAVQHLVPPTAVAKLPLNGREFWQLTELTPGTIYIPSNEVTAYTGTEIRADSVDVYVNGQSFQTTGWTLDGALITNMEFGGTLTQPNVDAIQEFNVEAGNMSAAYGTSPSMIVATLKSGTNRFHGTAYDYFRNDAFDARNFFLPDRLALKRNQFGGTLGGPIKRNKVFFFADYQGTRQRAGTPFSSVVPTAAERNGDFSDILPKTITNPLTGQPFPGNIIPPDMLSPQALYLTEQYMPLPNAKVGSTSRFIYGPNEPLENDEGDIKGTALITAKDTLMGRFSVSKNTEHDDLQMPALLGTDLTSQAHDGTAQWTHVFGPRLLNVAQVSYYTSPFLFGTVLQGVNVNEEAGIQGFPVSNMLDGPSMPYVGISGYIAFQGSPFDTRPKSIWERMWQYTDSMRYLAHGHDIEFGMNWLHRLDIFSTGGEALGNWSFSGDYTGNGFADFLLGYPHSGERGPVQTTQGDTGSFPAWFFEDTWRARHDLTLNLGVRFEVNPWMNGVNFTTSAIDLNTGKIIVPSGLQICPSPKCEPETSTLLPLFADRVLYSSEVGLPLSLHPTNHDWAPRVGVAWSPHGSQKTVIRSAYGIYYVYIDTNVYNASFETPPFDAVQQIFNSTPTPTRTFGNYFQGEPVFSPNPNPGQPCSFGLALLTCATPNSESAIVPLSQQYTQEWNLSVQHQLTNRVAMTAAYVGNRTNHLQTKNSPANVPDPGPGSIQARRPLPQWGNISLESWGAKSDYNALQVEVDSRDWHGLTLIGSYAYGKCLSNGSNENSPPAQQLWGAMYAPCPFDTTQATAMSYYYRLPVGQGHRLLGGRQGVLNEALGGWQLGGIVTLRSGMPFSANISNDRANTGAGGQWPNRIGTPLMLGNVGCWFYVASNSTCDKLAPNATSAFVEPAQYTYGNGGPYTLRSDALTGWDFSLLKNFPIRHEKENLEFRWEVFNFLNQPTFSAPSSDINLSSGGIVSKTLNANRIMQFALKFIF
jgi:Carboxypeptidase regulatory-like domain